MWAWDFLTTLGTTWDYFSYKIFTAYLYFFPKIILESIYVLGLGNFLELHTESAQNYTFICLKLPLLEFQRVSSPAHDSVNKSTFPLTLVSVRGDDCISVEPSFQAVLSNSLICFHRAFFPVGYHFDFLILLLWPISNSSLAWLWGNQFCTKNSKYKSTRLFRPQYPSRICPECGANVFQIHVQHLSLSVPFQAPQT